MEHRLVWETHMEACSALAILALAGWKDGKGVQSEISIAREMGKPIIFIAPDETDMTESAPAAGTGAQEVMG